MLSPLTGPCPILVRAMWNFPHLALGCQGGVCLQDLQPEPPPADGAAETVRAQPGPESLHRVPQGGLGSQAAPLPGSVELPGNRQVTHGMQRFFFNHQEMSPVHAPPPSMLRAWKESGELGDLSQAQLEGYGRGMGSSLLPEHHWGAVCPHPLPAPPEPESRVP